MPTRPPRRNGKSVPARGACGKKLRSNSKFCVPNLKKAQRTAPMAGARRTPARGLGEPDFLGILVAASHNTIFQVGLAMLEDLINQQWQALARLIRESKALGQLKLKALIARKKRRRKPSLADAIGKRRKANALEEYRRRFSPAARDAIPAPASLPATAQGFREPPQPPLGEAAGAARTAEAPAPARSPEAAPAARTSEAPAAARRAETG